MTERRTEPHSLHELLTVDDVAALLKVEPDLGDEHTRRPGAPRGSRLAKTRSAHPSGSQT
jgi:hypothetical protein